MKPEDSKAQGSVWRQIGRYAGLGTILPAAIFVGLAIGYGLDQWWHTGRTFQLIGLALGMAAGFWQIYRAAFRP
ncbi:MAG TPA: AtpZ/AtpI family protein [Terriglobales bacterium]|nr:AtpZ/AtpI family protein [Terriglobales bacterium]